MHNFDHGAFHCKLDISKLKIYLEFIALTYNPEFHAMAYLAFYGEKERGRYLLKKQKIGF